MLEATKNEILNVNIGHPFLLKKRKTVREISVQSLVTYKVSSYTMAVCFWHYVKVTRPEYACTVAYTKQVTIHEVPEKTRSCLSGRIVMKEYVMSPPPFHEISRLLRGILSINWPYIFDAFPYVCLLNIKKNKFSIKY